jgi:hypothetical protein
MTIRERENNGNLKRKQQIVTCEKLALEDAMDLSLDRLLNESILCVLRVPQI